jgi:hypothetical protein
MHPETVFAIARISDMKRELSHPMTGHRYEANSQRRAANRAPWIVWAGGVGRAPRSVVSGHRIGRAEQAA